MNKEFNTVEELATDESFISFSLDQSEQTAGQWEDWIAESEDRQMMAEEAHALVRQFALHLPTNELKEESIKLRQALSFLQPARPKFQFIRWAAAAVLLIMSGYFASEWTPGSQMDLSYIQPGTAKAVLTLDDGRTLDLCETCNIDEMEADGTSVQNNKGLLTYTSDELSLTEPMFNSIYIPRGGEYQLKLADGTKVWLNADTKFTYPVHFSGDSREVELTGEAYFEVAHNAAKPFHVITSSGVDVAVLGTEFNVKSYVTSSKTLVTLNKGSVAVKALGNQQLIKPDQQLIFNSNGNHMMVQDVDASIYSSWKDGLFSFDYARLDDMLADLGRWYDVDIEFENEKLKSYHFTGDLKRFDSFQTVLTMLEKATKIKFEVEDKVVLVKKK